MDKPGLYSVRIEEVLDLEPEQRRLDFHLYFPSFPRCGGLVVTRSVTQKLYLSVWRS